MWKILKLTLPDQIRCVFKLWSRDLRLQRLQLSSYWPWGPTVLEDFQRFVESRSECVQAKENSVEMAVDTSSWQSCHDSCQRLQRDIWALVSDRGNLPKTSVRYANLTEEIKVKNNQVMILWPFYEVVQRWPQVHSHYSSTEGCTTPPKAVRRYYYPWCT